MKVLLAFAVLMAVDVDPFMAFSLPFTFADWLGAPIKNASHADERR
jgi:hypothetical protein